MKFKYKLGFIGFGNMANAIYNGVINDGFLEKTDILIYDIDKEKLNSAQKSGILTANSNEDVVENCEYVILAIKPQQAQGIFSGLKCADNIIISIMAGIKKQALKKFFKNCAVVRCMPNSPALIGKGMTAIDCSDLESQNDSYNLKKQFVLSVFSSIGETAEVDDELMDAVTAVSGSGPAYVYLFVDALIKAGVSNGLSYETSKKLTLQTICGSAEMVKKSDKKTEDLINAVCSKGGTTIEAVKVFKDKKFEEIISDAVNSCYNRSKELSKI